MTLIVGTPVWKGICLTADTRATKIQNGQVVGYQDNVQKIAHVYGGIGMAAAGDHQTAIVFREELRKRLDELLKANLSNEERKKPIELLAGAIREALRRTDNHSRLRNRPRNQIKIRGLVGGIISWAPLILFPDECESLVKIMEVSDVSNEVWDKHQDKFLKCSVKKIKRVVLPEFGCSVLLKFRSELATATSPSVLDVARVPFGSLVAFGRGSNFSYDIFAPRVLSWVLFQPKPTEIDLAAMHLAQIHVRADQNIGIDPQIGFKTFGGAILPGFITEGISPTGERSPEYGMTAVVEGELTNKSDGKILSRVFSKKDKLFVQTKDGEILEIEEFPKISASTGTRLVLSQER